MEYRTLGDTIYLWFAVNSTAGEATDATGSPTFDVRKGGASSSGAPTLEGTATLLSHANYPAGCYEISIAATGGNGFEADAEYGVFCQAAVSSVNPAGFVGKFKLSPVVANVKQISDDSTAADTLELFVEALDQSTGQVDNGTFAAGAIDAAAIANGAIDAATFAADVDAEILSYLVDDATRIDASALNTATGTTIPAILVDTGTTLDGKLNDIETDTQDIQSKIGTPNTGDLASDIADVRNGVDNVETDTQDIQSRIPTSLSAGRIQAVSTLEDDAITAGKFDQSTAHPLASADSGSTAVARAGADGDTLETLSDQIDDVHTKTTNLSFISGRVRSVQY